MKSERIAQNETNLVFKPNCAEDVCLTDLKLHGRFLNFESPFELNSSRTMELQYNISNEGESGYGTLLEIKFARNISIIKAMAFCEIGADNLSCLINNGQALQRGKVITVNITLDATELDGTELDFEARLFSDGNETFNEDNLIQSSISLVRHSSVSIVEYFNPSHINLDTTFSNVSTSLKVQIDNYGPSYMRATNVTMFIPVLFKQMELIHFDTINSNIINERNYLEWTEECSVSNIEINHTSFIHWRKFESPAMVQKKSSYLSCFDEFITCKCLKFTLKELPAMNDPLWINLQMTIFPQAMINVMPEDTQTIFLYVNLSLEVPTDEVTLIASGSLMLYRAVHKFPLWVYVTTITLSTVILTSIVQALRKINFFKRMTRSDMERKLEAKESAITDGSIMMINIPIQKLSTETTVIEETMKPAT
ncbi:integrin alpha-PS4-like [Aedes aegypti]|uniref:Integrin alpha second immunoglobulin-like domain-containing protein n=1 Tax=Aedes aegypti TaxID=7159 RepID=A0A6I8TMZ8_AEDAE|nr:integrin alpha-PS4-like [Aedes aegypti]